jgi:hypothetical protein
MLRLAQEVMLPYALSSRTHGDQTGAWMQELLGIIVFGEIVLYGRCPEFDCHLCRSKSLDTTRMLGVWLMQDMPLSRFFLHGWDFGGEGSSESTESARSSLCENSECWT